ncbi:MAG: DNA-formamidopyrimidine glycosylase [Candidatus Omnitrophica bacterium 4484_49]|nr:MAG: DNA-formamidopyrimidine glycosylase [Candidatus Omnitrophica bacterium 4484_49]
MPELPEVETIRHDLQSLILGKRIKSIDVRDKNLLKKPRKLVSWRKGIHSKVKNVVRKGKFLILELANGFKIVIHLRMTGQLLYGTNEDFSIKLIFTDKSFLSYRDKRRLGEWYLVKDVNEIPLIKEMGIDPLSSKFNIYILKSLLEKKNKQMYNFLMDQRVIAGIGNIYANEILYRAKISPFRKSSELKDREIENLYYAILEILNKALKAGGSSIDSYLDAWGTPGKYSYEHLVYGKEGQFCPFCPSKIHRVKLGGRSVYYCPGCQQ